MHTTTDLLLLAQHAQAVVSILETTAADGRSYGVPCDNPATVTTVGGNPAA